MAPDDNNEFEEVGEDGLHDRFDGKNIVCGCSVILFLYSHIYSTLFVPALDISDDDDDDNDFMPNRSSNAAGNRPSFIEF
jgi:hypothetical protein